MSMADESRRVAVTGAGGFIGRNLAWFLQQRGIEVVRIGRDQTVEQMARALAGTAWVVHLAGVNRPEKVEDFQAGNVGMTERLIGALRQAGHAPSVVFASSIQAAQANPYGASKAQAEGLLAAYGEQTGAAVHNLRLPNIFGKWCRPNYNSAVATFCHNIARGLPIQVNDPARELTLMYVDDLCRFLVGLVEGQDAATYRDLPTYRITVGALADLIRSFSTQAGRLDLPQAGDGLGRALYATYVSALPTEAFSYDLKVHRDPRGEFAEFIHMGSRGQLSYFTANPGVTRGDHYHHSKVERFLVITGKAQFRYRQIETGETYELIVDGGTGKVVETIPGWTHNIKNVGSDTLVVALWANEIFDPAQPDTYMMKVDA